MTHDRPDRSSRPDRPNRPNRSARSARSDRPDRRGWAIEIVLGSGVTVGTLVTLGAAGVFAEARSGAGAVVVEIGWPTLALSVLAGSWAASRYRRRALRRTSRHDHEELPVDARATTGSPLTPAP
ncbi:hypothetical protein ACN20G_09890 [Streptomyces sp. BI20]|uniref:hypothetical protein n=1 Tax=Streptomyces sp. BI20 TaxID=3403460 RepID=UPI003C742DE5